MNFVVIGFNFISEISDEKWAKKLLDQIQFDNMKLSKLGFNEPINIPFSEDAFIKMWSVRDENNDHGNFLARFENSRIFLFVHGVKKSQFDNIGFEIVLSTSQFKNNPKWLEIFKTICKEWNPHNAYIEKIFTERDGYSYSIDSSKAQEVEWFNYWSDDLINPNNKKVIEYPWNYSERTRNGYFLKLIERLDDPTYLKESEKARKFFSHDFLWPRS